MENRRIIEGGEFWVPEVLIQRIQSFMSGKEAVQTSLLSKSWYNAWLTRPNLNLDQREFQTYEMFLEFANNTIHRYETMNLKIQSFKLLVSYELPSNCSIVNELIVKAMEMGALDFNFEISHVRGSNFTLPREVLESENLIKLSLLSCRIDFRADRKVSCWKLKSLCLMSVRVEEGDIIRDLISNCPLIEDVRLYMIAVHNSNHVSSYVFRSSTLYECCKLRSLCLGYVDVDTLFFSNLSSNFLFFSNLSSNFPCLKDLTLEYCLGYESIQISSRSLECISLMQYSLLLAEFDVPSIRKFKYTSVTLPSLLFRTTSREWESDILVGCDSCCTAWFLGIKKLLTCLNLSKIYLTITVSSIEEKNVDFRGLHETAVENLTIYAPSTLWLTVLEYLFWSCCPKFITLRLPLGDKLGTRGEVKIDFLEIVSERNVEGLREYCLTMNHELLEVDVQFFEESLAERHPLPQKVHFRLRWRE